MVALGFRRFRRATITPVHEVDRVTWQDRILQQLLSPLTLQRISDSELKVPADQDAFTAAELIHGLTASIFAEAEKLPSGDFTNRKPAISSLRRNLQRLYLKRLSELAMGDTQAPDDCQTIAYSELKSLEERINKVLARTIRNWTIIPKPTFRKRPIGLRR